MRILETLFFFIVPTISGSKDDTIIRLLFKKMSLSKFKRLINVPLRLCFFCLFNLCLLLPTLVSAKELVKASNRDSLKQVYRLKYEDESIYNLFKLTSNLLGTDNEKAFIISELAIEKALLLKDDGLLRFAYEKRAYASEMYHQYEDAIKYYRKALTKSYLPVTKAIIYNNIAITYRKAGQYKLCKDYHNLGLELAKEIKDLEMIEFAYNGIGFLYSKIGDYDEALKYYLLSLDIAEQRTDQKGIIISVLNVSNIYSKSENYPEAIDNMVKAYKLAEVFNDTILIATVLYDYAKVLKNTGSYEDALNKLQKTIDIYESKSHQYLIPKSLVYMGDIYIKMEQYEKAETYFKKALQDEKNIEADVYVHLYNELGKLYLVKNNIPKAKSYFEEALMVAQKNDLKSHSLVSYQNLYKIFAQKQDYKKALSYLEKATNLNNEISSKEKTDRIAELQFKYDVAKSERILNALKLRQNKLIMVGSSLLFMMVIGFLIYTNRMRAKNNGQLMHKNGEIQQQNIKLKESNAVLQQFAYVAAHDLKEPLRSIGSFVNLLERKHSKNFNAEAKEYMGFVRTSTHRMNNLVMALLQYSTISMEEPTYEMINMKEIVETVNYNLKDIISATEAQLNLENLPQIKINPIHATQLFQNLIGNALKFSEQNPVVTIRGWEEENQVVFSIKDNGVGMNEDYGDKVYKLFHQLDKRGEVEGTGIGLTICKNIVDKYDGKIWFSSKEGEGTEFFVSFPT